MTPFVNQQPFELCGSLMEKFKQELAGELTVSYLGENEVNRSTFPTFLLKQKGGTHGRRLKSPDVAIEAAGVEGVHSDTT